jgi:hypothetical protein
VHKEEFNNFCTSPDTTKVIYLYSWRLAWMEHVIYLGQVRNSYKSTAGKSEGKKPFGKPRVG